MRAFTEDIAKVGVTPTQALQELTRDKGNCGIIRINSIANLISCGADPFAPMEGDERNNPFIEWTYEITPEFLFTCLRAPMLGDCGREALRPMQIKRGIKRSIIMLSSDDNLERFPFVIQAMIRRWPKLVENQSLAEQIMLTTYDWQHILNDARERMSDLIRSRIETIKTDAISPTALLQHVLLKVDQERIVIRSEDLCSLWFELVRQGADIFKPLPDQPTENAYTLMLGETETELHEGLLMVERETEVGIVRVFSDAALIEGLERTRALFSEQTNLNLRSSVNFNVRSSVEALLARLSAQQSGSGAEQGASSSCADPLADGEQDKQAPADDQADRLSELAE